MTLGALSFPRDAAGNIIRGMKRHPTLEDDVVVYANATILGGDTVIGHHCRHRLERLAHRQRRAVYRRVAGKASTAHQRARIAVWPATSYQI